MSLVGIAWASQLAMPFAILSSAGPHRKMGIYMSMFNRFVVIPQIPAAAGLGLPLGIRFHRQATGALATDGAVMVPAGFAVLFVKDKAEA